MVPAQIAPVLHDTSAADARSCSRRNCHPGPALLRNQTDLRCGSPFGRGRSWPGLGAGLRRLKARHQSSRSRDIFGRPNAFPLLLPCARAWSSAWAPRTPRAFGSALCQLVIVRWQQLCCVC